MFIPQIEDSWIEKTCTRVQVLGAAFTPEEQATTIAILNKLFSDTNGVLKMANHAIVVQVAVDAGVTSAEDGAALLVKGEREFQAAVGNLLATYAGLLLRVVYRAAHRVLFTVGGMKPVFDELNQPEAK